MSDARSSTALVAALALCACTGLGAAHAQLPNEPLSAESLSRAEPHWVWVNDMAFPDGNGKAFLIDADRGRMLGMLSTGFSFNGVIVPRAADVIYSPETYLARGGRGARTDLLAIYDSAQLQPVAEIELPPKRASTIPMMNAAVLTDDERFLLIYNFTPAQSVSVVDVVARRFVGELDTSGCALVYPTGARSFFSICGDGSLLEVTIDDAGRAAHLAHSPVLFDGMKDPLSEKAVRLGTSWLFVSVDAVVYPIETTAKGTRLGAKWSLVSRAEQTQGWRSGGLQHLALHRATGRLYAIMHRGDAASRKEPGVDIWVYDLASHRKVQQITARNKLASITVSQDAHPLLFGAFMGRNALDIYDALSGEFERTVDELGLTPSTLVSAWTPEAGR